MCQANNSMQIHLILFKYNSIDRAFCASMYVFPRRTDTHTETQRTVLERRLIPNSMQITEADSVSSLEIGILDTVFHRVNFATTKLSPRSRYVNYYD